MSWFIFDLDGTLALIEERRSRARLSSGKMDFDVMFDPDLITLDEPNWPVINSFKALQKAGFQVGIFSGRSAVTEQETKDWLTNYGVKPDLMVMREEGDYTPDDQLKKSWFIKYFGDGSDVEAIFDDRQKVVDMWRSIGLTCFQVAPGNF